MLNIDLWRVLLDQPQNSAGILSADERERRDKLITPELQIRFERGRAALRHILGNYVKIAPADLRFDYNAWGKPSLANAPKLAFNLAHSGDLMLLAVLANEDGLRLGLDLEALRPLEDMRALAETIATPAELAQLAALGNTPEAFFTLWTRKEAYLKALGAGFSLEPQDVSVSLDANPRILKAAAGEQIKGWTLESFIPWPNTLAALAIDAPSIKLTYKLGRVDI